MGSSTYNAEALKKVCVLLMVASLRREKFTIITGEHPELDSSSILG